jgi:hypothetical protein
MRRDHLVNRLVPLLLGAPFARDGLDAVAGDAEFLNEDLTRASGQRVKFLLRRRGCRRGRCLRHGTERNRCNHKKNKWPGRGCGDKGGSMCHLHNLLAEPSYEATACSDFEVNMVLAS